MIREYLAHVFHNDMMGVSMFLSSIDIGPHPDPREISPICDQCGGVPRRYGCKCGGLGYIASQATIARVDATLGRVPATINRR